MGVNLTGVMNGVRHFVPRMLAANARGEPGISSTPHLWPAGYARR